MEINSIDVRINVSKERKVGSEGRFWPELKGPGREGVPFALTVPLPSLPHAQATS